MMSVLISMLLTLRGLARSRVALHLKVLAMAPRYLVHDRDSAFYAWTTTAEAIGIEEVLTAPHSPWQYAYAERLIGSTRRAGLDHMVIANERGLRGALTAYVEYYLKSRTH